MNIFALDLNIKKCAEYHVDKHVVKMISEYAQLLCTTVNLHGFSSPMKSTHINHPSRLWLEESRQNMLWLDALLFELHEEWKYRYNHKSDKVHKSYGYWDSFKRDNPDWLYSFPDKPLTDFKLAMPDECKSSDAIESYRLYYKNHKKHLHSWRNRTAPCWINEKVSDRPFAHYLNDQGVSPIIQNDICFTLCVADIYGTFNYFFGW